MDPPQIQAKCANSGKLAHCVDRRVLRCVGRTYVALQSRDGTNIRQSATENVGRRIDRHRLEEIRQ